MEASAPQVSAGGSASDALRQEIVELVRGEIDRIGDRAASVAGGRLAEAEATAAAEQQHLEQNIAEAAREIRSAGSPGQAMRALGEVAAGFCDRSVVLLNHGNCLRGYCAAGKGTVPSREALARISFAPRSAPVLAHAMESRGTVSANGGQHNFSHELAKTCALEREAVHAIPIVLRETVLGVILVIGQARVPLVESLVMLTEAWVEVLGSRGRG